MPTVFHGNLVSTDESLVFTDFGWDLLTTMKEAGFSDVVIDLYVDLKRVHIGNAQLIFRCIK